MSKKKRERMKAKQRRHAPSPEAGERQPSTTSSRPPRRNPGTSKRKRPAKRWLGLTGRQWLWICVGVLGALVVAWAVWWLVRDQPGPAETAIPTTSPAVSQAEDEPASLSISQEGDRPLAKLAPSERVNYYSSPPELQIDPSKQYVATIHTEKGDIVVQLYADLVPNTVNNFVFLANQGYYDNTTFHRVIPGFMAQAGDPSGTGGGGPGYSFADEFSPQLRHDGPGVMSMANRGANTNGSQFFITYEATPHLDDAHAVFGRVVEGMDVLEQISPRDPATAGEPGDLIESITIEER